MAKASDPGRDKGYDRRRAGRPPNLLLDRTDAPLEGRCALEQNVDLGLDLTEGALDVVGHFQQPKYRPVALCSRTCCTVGAVSRLEE